MSINENEMLITTNRLKNLLAELQFGINDLKCYFEEAQLFQFEMQQMTEGVGKMMNTVNMIEASFQKYPPDEPNCINNVPFVG